MNIKQVFFLLSIFIFNSKLLISIVNPFNILSIKLLIKLSKKEELSFCSILAIE